MVAFPQFRTLDLGAVYGQAEAIRGARTRNQMLTRQNEQEKQTAKLNAEYQRIRQMNENMPQAIAQAREEGQFEVAARLQMAYRANLESTGKMLESVKGMVRDQDDWDIMREQLITGGVPADVLPMDFKGTMFDAEIQKNRADLAKIKAETDRARASAEKSRADAAGGGARGLKAADASLIYRQAAQMHGGFYDEATGAFRGFDDATASKAQALAEEAERVFAEGGKSHAQAVAEAARRQGFPVRSLNPGNDPLGMRTGGAPSGP